MDGPLDYGIYCRLSLSKEQSRLDVVNHHHHHRLIIDHRRVLQFTVLVQTVV
jgi:hypothetical protein